MLEGETCDGHPRAIKDDARICFILDCCRCKITDLRAIIILCRNAFRDGKPALAVAMKHQKGFDLKMAIEKLDFNDQILLIKSCLLGHKAADNNSFTQQLLRWL